MRTVSRVHDWVLNALKLCSQAVIFGVFVLIVVDVGITILADINNWLLSTEFGTGSWDMILVALKRWLVSAQFEIQPWDMTHGLVEYGLLWFTMLAAPWLARVKGHVFIDAVTELLSPAIQKVTAKFAYLVAFTGSVAFSYYSVLLLVEAIEDEMIDERGADMWQWTLYFPMPFAFALVAVEVLRYLFGIDDMYGRRTDVKEGM